MMEEYIQNKLTQYQIDLQTEIDKPVPKEELLKIAKKLEKAKIIFSRMGAMNTWGLSTEERIGQSADYQIAKDEMYALQRQYDIKFAKYCRNKEQE